MTDEPLAVVTPTTGVDPRTALATSIHDAPGVYALLIGSGLSSAAGVPTGWQVVQDLVRRTALADGVDPAEIGDEPAEWWARQGRLGPRYDDLLAALAPTRGARHAILRRYFDPPPDGGPPILPTAAHAAVASLVASGRVRVVVTTNFDRLIERALDAAGVSAQVISLPEAVHGMEPLCHSPATVVKLHGDYASLDLRNTPEELDEYPAEWEELLARIFDEYGLVVVGWSGDWDTALSRALVSAPSRRYPMYWMAHQGQMTENARRVVAARSAHVISAGDADSFFSDLTERLQRLDTIATRQGRPRLDRTPRLAPEQGAPPQGWVEFPLLQLHVAALVEPTTYESVGYIRMEDRTRLLEVLEASSACQTVRSLASNMVPVSAEPEGEAVTGWSAPSQWALTPDAVQQRDAASYRLGGDGSSGVSTLMTIRPPSFALGSALVIMLDVGMSVELRVQLLDLCILARDALVLVTGEVPDALVELIPSEAEVTRAEVHFFSSPRNAKSDVQRRMDLLNRLNTEVLGRPTRQVGPWMGFQARIGGPLTRTDASDLVVAGLEHMALDHGWIDPRRAVEQMTHMLQ